MTKDIFLLVRICNSHEGLSKPTAKVMADEKIGGIHMLVCVSGRFSLSHLK